MQLEGNVNLIDDLIASLPDDVAVKSVQVGVHWTMVSSRHCGLASTLVGNQPHGHAKVRDVGRLQLKSAHELAEYARSDNVLEASIGIAAINSLIEVEESQVVEMNAGDVLIQQGRGKQVALVGHFPFISQLRASARELWVIEQQPTPDEYPAGAAANLIPQADVVAITGTALINHTLDGLLALCNPKALVMVLGPSTPLSRVLLDHGVSILSGAQVVDEATALRTLCQGATFQQMEGVRLVTLRRDQSI
jgi:uncharacterized protein (DUF4213/DUF364 family)